MVVMPEYLKTSSKQNPNKPRIISEVKKTCFSKLKLSFTTSLQEFGKSKYTGQLLWKTENSNWVLTAAEVRQGSLILINKESSEVVLRQTLRELNLRPCSNPKTFCLEDANRERSLIFRALTEDDYEKWIRILAVELIRQTPFQNVRFLDILSIIKIREPDKSNLRRGRSEECITKSQDDLWNQSKTRFHLTSNKERKSRITEPIKSLNPEENAETFDIFDKAEGVNVETKKVKIKCQNSVPILTQKNQNRKAVLIKTQSMSSLTKVSDKICNKQLSDESGISSGDENTADEIARNVDSFSYISVRERKNFFESLTAVPKTKVDNYLLVRSNSISNFKQTNLFLDQNKLNKKKRTKSLHDLHKTPVKAICQLFESQDVNSKVSCQPNKTTEKNAMAMLTQRRLQRGERKLEKLRNQIVEVEETIKSVAEDIKSIEKSTSPRREDLELFGALQRRLDEENSRLERLRDEMTRVIKGNQRTIMKLERSNEKKN